MQINKEYTVMGNKGVSFVEVTLNDEYPSGGLTLDALQELGLNVVDQVLVDEPRGFSFKHADGKLKVFRPAPPIVYEEKHAPAGDGSVQSITTDYPPAFFINAGRVAKSKTWRSTGVVPGDDEISLDAVMAEGERATLSVKDFDRLEGDGAFGAFTNWTSSATEWTEGTGDIAKDADGTGTCAHDVFAAVAGRSYLLTFTTASHTAGTVTASIGDTDGDVIDAAGTHSMVITATNTDGLVFTPSNDARFVLDDVDIYDLSEPVYVTYVTEAWKEVWDNLVQDEEVTLASAGATTLENACSAVMYSDRISATAKALILVDEDDTAASGEVAIYFNQAADNIKATNAAENGKVAKFTYIKAAASGFLKDRAFDNETATKAGSDPYTNTFDYPILLWGYTGQVPVNTGVTQRILPYMGTPAAGDGVIDWFNPGVRGAGAPAKGTVFGCKSNVTATGAGIWGVLNEVTPTSIEVPDGTKLTGTFRMMFIGV